MLVQMLKNQPNMQDVFLQIDQVHHEVVHINDEPSFCKVISEDMIYEHLEGRQWAALAKEHHHWFIKPVRSSKAAFHWLVSLIWMLLYPQQMSSLVKYWECFNVSMRSCGRGVFDSMGVDVIIVLAGMEHTILLQNKEEGACLQEFGGNDLTLLFLLLHLCCCSFQA